MVRPVGLNNAQKGSMFAHPRVVLLLPVPYDPRFRRRIHVLKEGGATCEVFSFDRNYFASGATDYTFNSLGRFHHGKYLDRPPKLLRAVPNIGGFLQDDDIIYCMGLDLAVLGVFSVWFSRKPCKIVYECADIVSRLYGPSRTSRSLRALERWVLDKCDCVVVTSPQYVSEYFVKEQRQLTERFFLIENKVADFMPTPMPLSTSGGHKPLHLGYFGLLRDPMAWQIMLAWAQSEPERLRLDVHGHPFGIAGIEQDIAAHANIAFGGEYIYPDDLPALYGGVDLVWVTYPKSGKADDIRWQWPRTNRFYEACYFGKPMIGQSGSADGDLIEKLDIGLTIDTGQPEAALSRLLAIRPDDLARWTANLLALPPETYLYTDEHQRLLAALT